MKIVKLAFMGFGHAAQAFAKIVSQKEMALSQLGFEVRASVVVTGTKGNCCVPEGVKLERLMADLDRYGKFQSEELGVTSVLGLELLRTADYDVMLELSPLNIETGQPAIDHIVEAFNRGKHVITANKGPIAWRFHELLKLSREKNVEFLYETTVMDGTPIFNLYRETLPMCEVTEIKGILNTTTNFILESMALGLSYNEAMTEGRKRGFVEADPSLDIEGYDAAAKLCALVNVLMKGEMVPNQVDRKGIEDITLEAIEAAELDGQKIKLLCHAVKANGQIMAKVEPTRVNKTDLYAGISGTSSVVSLTTDLMGQLTIVEHDPEIEQTGFGIFSDLICLLKRLG